MRTSLNNIKTIEEYISGTMKPEDSIVFQANMLLNDNLKKEVQEQQNTYDFIKQYGRKSIRKEIVAVQEIIASKPEHSKFMRHITAIFK